MLASVTIKVDGLSELAANLRKLSSDMQTKIARRATGNAASVIRKRARELAPVAPSNVTPAIPYERLRKAIVAKRVPPSQTPFTSEHFVVIRGGKKNFYASQVGSLLEFGTVHMSPKPFMRPAFEQENGFAVSKMIQAIREGIDKAGKL